MRSRIFARILLAVVLFVALAVGTLGTGGAATAHASGPVPLVTECQYTKLVGYSASFRSVPLNNYAGIATVDLEMFAYNDRYTNRYCGPAYGYVDVQAGPYGLNGVAFQVCIDQYYGSVTACNNNSLWESAGQWSGWYPVSYGLWVNDTCQNSYAAWFVVDGDSAGGNYVCFQA